MELSKIIVGCMKLGSWGANSSPTDLGYFVDGCLDLGLRDFDHADIYGDYTTETQFGQLIRKRPDLKAKLRVTTKCGIALPSKNRPQFTIKHYNQSKAYVLSCIEQSLNNLGIEQIHLFLLHRPDILMDTQEVAEAVRIAKERGYIAHFGVSNFTPSQFELLNATVPLATNQIEASIGHLAPFQDGTIDQLYRLNRQPTAWSPLGGGRILNGSDNQSKRILAVGKLLCEKYDCSMDQLLFAWLMRHPSGIIPITGTSKLDRVRAALSATEIQLEAEDWYQLWTASAGKDVA